MTTDSSDEMMPPVPPPLTRSITRSVVDSWDDNEDPTVRYLQYECNYKTCVHPGQTWGWIIKNDYPHFLHLMKTYVPRGSNTFTALRSQLRPGDIAESVNAVRHYDTEAGKAETKNIYLGYTCSHNGRMNGKTWKEISTKDYAYFCWAVGNTMGRETRTFEVLSSCLKPEDRDVILKTPKGKYKTKKRVVVAEPAP